MNNLCFEQEKLLCNEPYQVKCYYFRFAQGGYGYKTTAFCCAYITTHL